MTGRVFFELHYFSSLNMNTKRIAFIVAWAIVILLGVSYVGKKSAKALLESGTVRAKVEAARLKAQLPAQPSAPSTGADLEGVRIGDSQERIIAMLGARVQKQEKRVKWGLGYSDHWIERHNFHGVPLEVFFQMDDDSGLLFQILLREQVRGKPRDSLLGDFQKLENALTAKYGLPVTTERSSLHERRMWLVGTTEIHLDNSQDPTGSGAGDEMLTVRYRNTE